MIQVLPWNVRDVDGVSTKVKEVVGYDQGEADINVVFRLGVDSVAAMGLANICSKE